jgi:hypothetical protein
MPSHADRVRRQNTDADGREPFSPTGPAEAFRGPLSEVAKYAGWLAKDHVSVAVRADVKALTAALDAGHETSLLLMTLGTNVGRLPSGGVRTLLRKALAEVRTALGQRSFEGVDGAGS